MERDRETGCVGEGEKKKARGRKWEGVDGGGDGEEEKNRKERIRSPNQNRLCHNPQTSFTMNHGKKKTKRGTIYPSSSSIPFLSFSLFLLLLQLPFFLKYFVLTSVFLL